jgi:hypothetical protein
MIRVALGMSLAPARAISSFRSKIGPRRALHSGTSIAATCVGGRRHRKSRALLYAAASRPASSKDRRSETHPSARWPRNREHPRWGFRLGTPTEQISRNQAGQRARGLGGRQPPTFAEHLSKLIQVNPSARHSGFLRQVEPADRSHRGSRQQPGSLLLRLVCGLD